MVHRGTAQGTDGQSSRQAEEREGFAPPQALREKELTCGYLVDDSQSQKWILEHFHPDGLRCPKCNSTRRRFFRKTQTSQLTVYRCLECEGIYNLYSSTVFEKKHLRPSQVVLLLRGVSKGESSMKLAKELSLSRTTVHELRKQLQANAQSLHNQMSPL